ncbi:replication factor-a protein [Nadsonia fulvescens var. elongata DSM 6958]|uniref:Replication protein A subunit n=1 Tax=Nadsonia fulvescens var. elongata DSM 6958 TaxID=857566 RepID=A0A1E3PKU4_9ASCO|nr:replication factor-a protein [Nadsonia fulvescens var. elongata DSM 6958]
MGNISNTLSESVSKGSDLNKNNIGRASSAGSFYAKPESSVNEKVLQPHEKLASLKNIVNDSRIASQKSTTILPIEAISPYSNGFVLKVTCTRVGDIKTWSNSRGEGKLFWANFMDNSGEIRATGFNDEVDKFHSILKEGKTFLVSNCKVVVANKQFSNLKNDSELRFDRETTIEECDDADSKPQYKFDFVNIADINNVDTNSNIDVIGVLKEYFDVTSTTSKTTGRSFDRRDIILADKSGYTVRGTIWGKTAQDFNQESGTIIAIKGAKVSDFRGKNISVSSSSLFLVNPEIPEAYALRDWFNTGYKELELKDLSNMDGANTASAASKFETHRTTIDEVMGNPDVGKAEKGEYFTVVATVLMFKSETFAYPSCQSDNCNKKVIEDSDGRWRCERCDKSFDTPAYRYILNLNIADHTSHTWVTAFDDSARVLLDGTTADELTSLRDGDETAFRTIFHNNQGKEYVFRCRAKQEFYKDESKIRTQIMDAQPIDYLSEAKKLIENIGLF